MPPYAIALHNMFSYAVPEPAVSILLSSNTFESIEYAHIRSTHREFLLPHFIFVRRDSNPLRSMLVLVTLRGEQIQYCRYLIIHCELIEKFIWRSESFQETSERAAGGRVRSALCVARD